jgi:hypothetical protein
MVGNEGSVLVMRSSRSPQHGRATAEKADAWRHHNMRSLSCHTEFDHDVVDTPALKQRVCRRQRVELCRPTRERHCDFDENCGGARIVETLENGRMARAPKPSTSILRKAIWVVACMHSHAQKTQMHASQLKTHAY